MMSHPNLLGLLLESFTSCCSTPPQPPQTTRPTRSERASKTGIRIHSSATSLANSFPLTDLTDEHDKKVEAVAESMEKMNGAIARRLTTVLATICGVHGRRHNEKSYVEEAVKKNVHMLNICIHEGELFCEDDHDVFEEVQKEEESLPRSRFPGLLESE